MSTARIAVGRRQTIRRLCRHSPHPRAPIEGEIDVGTAHELERPDVCVNPSSNAQLRIRLDTNASPIYPTVERKGH